MKILHIIIILVTLTFVKCQTKTPDKNISKISEDEISIEYIAHACFIIEANGKRIMLDPYADKVWLGYDFPKGLKMDAVFITHPHYDHDGGIFRGKKPDWMCDTPFYQDPKEYEVGNFSIKGIVGKHADPYGKEFGQMNTIWKIKINGIVFAHWGDNGPLTDENTEALKDVDVLLIPMDGDFHIIPPEAYANTFKFLEPKIIIPMHYRIPELESKPDAPKNLGEIGPFLEKRPLITIDSLNTYLPDIQYLDTNSIILSAGDLPKRSTYYVFQHSPAVTAASVQ